MARVKEDTFKSFGNTLEESLRLLERNIKNKAAREAAGKESQPTPKSTPAPAPAETRPSALRPAPESDIQADFFVPSLFDIPVKDGVDLMDVAMFRLSKSQTRRGDIIRYELADAKIEVAGGAYGMATIWDYDVVLMSISHLADAVRRWKAGRGPKPTNRFRTHAVDILKFCRLPDGGQQYENINKTLTRLQGTFVRIEHTHASSKKRRTGYFPLIGGANVISRTDTGKVAEVEIVISEYIYEAVCEFKTPEILTMDPDYLLIRGGLARFIYRLARKAAGKNSARYSFRTIHERSGSTREFKKFAHDLRELLRIGDLPGYSLAEDKGSDGPVLVMTRKAETTENPAETA